MIKVHTKIKKIYTVVTFQKYFINGLYSLQLKRSYNNQSSFSKIELKI